MHVAISRDCIVDLFAIIPNRPHRTAYDDLRRAVATGAASGIILTF